MESPVDSKPAPIGSLGQQLAPWALGRHPWPSDGRGTKQERSGESSWVWGKSKLSVSLWVQMELAHLKPTDAALPAPHPVHHIAVSRTEPICQGNLGRWWGAPVCSSRPMQQCPGSRKCEITCGRLPKRIAPIVLGFPQC